MAQTTPQTGGVPTSTATPPSFQFSAGTSAFTATSTPTTTAGATVTPTPGASLNTATTTTASSSINAPQMNFRQLQELANKWTMELEEHERVFIEQATQVNSWDKTLMANGDKIAKLSDSVEKVKVDHMRLEHTLDFLKNQQREFDGYLVALETSVPENRVADPEREYLHNLAENMDTQLQQMAEDLKDVIRHINDVNKPLEKADPVAQILKILNEHTDALQWVEDNTIAVKKSLDDVTKLNQMFRRDQERSFRLLYKK